MNYRKHRIEVSLVESSVIHIFQADLEVEINVDADGLLCERDGVGVDRF